MTDQRLTTKKIDQYQFWRHALAGHRMPMHEGDPQPGFYRLKERDGVDSAVAYWLTDHNNGMACVLNGKLVPPQKGIDLWTYCCDKPVTHEAYTHRIRAGMWPNEIEALVTRMPAAGHNQPPPDNSMDALLSVLDAIEREAKRILDAGPAKTQDEVDQASDIANELGDLEKRVVEAHRVEKAPVLANAKRIDGKWFALRDKANDLKSKIKLRVVTPFLVKVKRDQEIALAAAQQAGVDLAEVQVEKPRAGSIKRTTSLKMVKTARIEQFDLVLGFFSTNKEIIELVQKLADRAVRAGVSVPGCAVLETEQAV